MNKINYKKNNYGYSGFITVQSEGAIIEKSFSSKYLKTNHNYSFINDSKVDNNYIDYNNPDTLSKIDETNSNYNDDYKIDLDHLREYGMGIFIGDNAAFGFEFKNDRIKVGDIFYSSTEDEPYLISKESRIAIVTKIKHGTVDSPGEIEIQEQTEDGPVTKVYTLESFDEITSDYDRYIRDDKNILIRDKYISKWINNAGLQIVNGFYSIFGMKKSNKSSVTIGQIIIKNVFDYGTGGDYDLSPSELGSQISFSTFSSCVWILADHRAEFLPESISEPLSSKGGNAILTGGITATLDFSKSALSGRNDAYLNGEAEYAKQYAKAKFSSDFEGNIFDIVGATLLDFFLPGVGSWIGGPILNGIKEMSYCCTEYYLEVNNKPVPSRPSEAYDNFNKRRKAVAALKSAAEQLYQEKSKMYSKDSIEYKNAVIEYTVDKNGYGNVKGVISLLNISCNDPTIKNIPYSKENTYNNFGVNEDWYAGTGGLNSYGFVEWVIHNAGFKVNKDILNDIEKYKINDYHDFAVLMHEGTISVGDVMYRDVNHNGEIGEEDRCYIVSNITENSITLVRQWSYGVDEKTYTFNSTEDYENFMRDTNMSGLINMDDYYANIEDNVDYSRKDIQETIDMIGAMENND